MYILLMGRLRAGVLVAGLLAGCSNASQTAATPSAPGVPTLTPPPEVAALIARPVRLPELLPGSNCPVTPVAKREVGVTDPRGNGPFYLGGPMPKGNFAFNKIVYVLADNAVEPVLFRGGRIDGPGVMTFAGNSADPADRGTILSSGGGVTESFYPRALDAFYIYPHTTGCYAIQVDGPTFQDVIVLAAG
jgi:hypothetical protein